jgi:hypothetical protein
MQEPSLLGNSVNTCRASSISSFFRADTSSSSVNSGVAALDSDIFVVSLASLGLSVFVEKNPRKKTPMMITHANNPKINTHGALLVAGRMVFWDWTDFFLFRPLIFLCFLVIRYFAFPLCILLKHPTKIKFFPFYQNFVSIIQSLGRFNMSNRKKAPKQGKY